MLLLVASLVAGCVFPGMVLPVSAAAKEIVLHSFGRNRFGLWPYGPVIFGAHGELYGTTISGGAHQSGVVFRLKPGRNGKWVETVLHGFQNNGEDGYWPFAGLISDAHGNLYGTTAKGGRYDQGTVFELTSSRGRWTEKVLYHFVGGTDGAMPYASLISDAAGNLYGTTYQGGNSGCRGIGCGTVFELMPAAGKWNETVLYTFQDNGVDGHQPYGGLILDSEGNLYGTTAYGPVYGYWYDGPGTVFELSPNGNGQWTETVLFTFCPGNDCSGGACPFSNLIFDASGNIYGTAAFDGFPYGMGTVFELSPGANGQWTEKALYTFCSPDSCQDGNTPYAGVTFDADGNLYGTTTAGTTNQSYCGGPGCGIVFKLVPGNGAWTEQVVRSFSGEDGGIPYAGLVSDRSGNLCGTTTSGGAYGNGTVFEITP